MARSVAGGLMLLTALLLSSVARSQADQADGGTYYYPAVSDTEMYRSMARQLPDTSRERRIGFVVSITGIQLQRGHAPLTAIFANGEDAEQLIIVAVADGRLNTKYRVRAFFSTLTALSRATPMFAEFGVETTFNFYDLAKMLGFTTITVSNGVDYTYQVIVR